MLAFSRDGLEFRTEPEPFVRRAHVPTVAQDAKGRILALFQWFPETPRESFDRIAAKISEDGGKTWTEPRRIEITGLPERHIRPCDPALVALADGRVRLYFTCDLLDGRGPCCLSAVSEDGIRYVREPGVRFAPEGGVLDPAVVRLGSVWHYYAPGRGPRRGNFHAVSRDGLTFERKPDIALDGMQLLGSAVAADGGIRFYNGARSAFSPDGHDFRLDPGTRVAGNDPGITRLRDGRYLMVYGKLARGRRRPPRPREGPRLGPPPRGPAPSRRQAPFPPGPPSAPRRPPFLHHQDSFIRGVPYVAPWVRYDGRGPTPASLQARRFVESWERGRSGRFETMGVAIQQLADDFPEVIRRIRALRIPVTRYGGVGHVEPAPVGRMRDLSGMTLEEAIRAQWEFETHTLVPDWHLEGDRLVLGNPRAGRPIRLDELPLYNLPREKRWLFGGTLAIQVVLGVTPLDFGQEKIGGRRPEPTVFPTTAVKRALGMGRWANPKGSQWDPENAPLAFYRRTYGVSSFEEVLAMPCPVGKILELMTPDERERLERVLGVLGEHARARRKADPPAWQARLLAPGILRDLPPHLDPQWPSPARDLPAFLEPREKEIPREAYEAAARAAASEAGGLRERLSAAADLTLAEAFQAFAFALEGYAIHERLPDRVTVRDVVGPVRHPLASEGDRVEIPRDVELLLEVDRGAPAYLRLLGDRGARTRGIPRALDRVNPVSILHSAWWVAREIRRTGAVPGAIPIYLAAHAVAPPVGGGPRRRPPERLTAINPAEFLAGMAREIVAIRRRGLPAPIRLEPVPCPGADSGASRRALHAAWTGEDSAPPRRIARSALTAAAAFLAARRPRISHDGDYGGPPDFVPAGGGDMSLAEAFTAFALALAAHAETGELPEAVEVPRVLGPIDHLGYELPVRPLFDPEKRIGGWQPCELPREHYPDPRLLEAQGFVGRGNWGRFQGRASIEAIAAAAGRAAGFVRRHGHVPATTALQLLRGRGMVRANAAELLYAMAGAYARIDAGGGAPIMLLAVKIVEDQECRSVTVSTPVACFGGRLASGMTMGDIFTWRAPVSLRLLHRAWTYVPGEPEGGS